MTQYGLNKDQNNQNNTTQSDTDTLIDLSTSKGRAKRRREKVFISLPPKLSETFPGQSYHENPVTFLAEICPNMIAPLVAAVEFRGKDKKGKLIFLC